MVIDSNRARRLLRCWNKVNQSTVIMDSVQLLEIFWGQCFGGSGGGIYFYSNGTGNDSLHISNSVINIIDLNAVVVFMLKLVQ